MRVKKDFLTQSPGGFDEQMFTQARKIRFLINRAGCNAYNIQLWPAPIAYASREPAVYPTGGAAGS